MLTFFPLTPERFGDFERLFGPRGACGGCWCMFWKITGKDYHLLTGDGTYQMQKSIVEQGVVPGILAFDGETPVGWIAVEPRREFPRLARSRVLKPVDAAEVWSVTCFFTAKSHRRKGVTVQLLQEAVRYVASKGGKIVEGYPVEPKGEKAPDPFVFTGLPGAFLKVGFVEVARFSPTRPIFRYIIP
ncbi:MAG: GNAT family N-acetyltransferase [Chloroflexi bacterium]|nr:GNAT family N-acetyltransferase [Chloroflexota bacterium]